MKKTLSYRIGACVALGTILMSVLTTQSAFAGTLACTMTTAALCTGGTNTIILRLSNSTNAHAELPSQATGSYANNVVCCSGVTGLSNACTAPSQVVLRLAGATNAHAEENTYTTAPYTSNACISVPTGNTISVGYGANCTGYDTFLGSISSATNAHVATSTAYGIKICASSPASTPLLNVSGTVTSSVFDSTGLAVGGGFNSIMWNGTLGAGSTGKVRFQFATASAPTGPWTYIGGTTCGVGDWFDALTPGVPVELKGTGCLTAWSNYRYFKYKVQICSNDCTTAGSYTPTVTGIVVNWAQ